MKHRSSSQVIAVFVTCPSAATGRRLAGQLVKQRLVACVNTLPMVRSTFLWKGRLERCQETLLIMKTTLRRFPRLRRTVSAWHPYEVPEIIALPVIAAHSPYLQWVRRMVAS